MTYKYKAVSYYYDMMRGISQIQFHKTGKAATERALEIGKGKFITNPTSKDKQKAKITKSKLFKFGLSHRYTVAKFLSDKELENVNNASDVRHIIFDSETNEFIEREGVTIYGVDVNPVFGTIEERLSPNKVINVETEVFTAEEVARIIKMLKDDK